MQHFHSEPEPQSVYTHTNASPLNTNSPTDALDAAEQRRLQESIEDYLDRVCRPIMDTLPYAARQELRREIAQHLNALVQAYRESGYAPALATEKALDKFGPPHLVAQKWNPVTVGEGQYKRMERWFAGQWQGIAATLVLCGAAGFLGLMMHRSGALSPHSRMSRSQPSIASAATPTYFPRPFNYTATAIILHSEQQAALNQARAQLEEEHARLEEQQAAMQQAEASLALAVTHFSANSASREEAMVLHRAEANAEVIMQQNNLETHRILVQQFQRIVAQRQAAVAQETAKLEAIRSQQGHRGL